MDNGKGLYGEKTGGQGIFCIGVDSSNSIAVGDGTNPVNIKSPVVFSDIQEVSPNTSATTSMTSSKLLIYNGSTVGTANIVLPSSPIDGEVAKIIAKPAITVSTVTGGSKTVNAGATSFSANTAIEYIYSATTGEWHKSQ